MDIMEGLYMLTIDKLTEFGADVKSGLEICMNNEEFYLKMVNLMIQDNQVDKLKESIDAGDLDAAFEAAHALKGVTGNLGLTPIRKPVLEITELLRARTEMDYSELVEEIEKQKDILTKLAE